MNGSNIGYWLNKIREDQLLALAQRRRARVARATVARHNNRAQERIRAQRQPDPGRYKWPLPDNDGITDPVWDHLYNHFAMFDPSCSYCQERPTTRAKRLAIANYNKGQTAKGDQS